MTLYDIFYDEKYGDFEIYDKDFEMSIPDILAGTDDYDEEQIKEFLMLFHVLEIVELGNDEYKVIVGRQEILFDAKSITKDCIQWIKKWFDKNGKGCNAVVGISGGKDSSIVAALCVAALGKDRVIGVLMPNGEQADIDMSKKLVKYLNINSFEVNISEAINSILYPIENLICDNGIEISKQTIINLPARIRMATLYAVSQSMNGRVANTCNLSEDWVGYATRYGDAAGDFSPLSNLTVTEVKEIGRVLGLPDELIDKVPSDGLCGKTDEDNLGFTYDVLDKYIRTGEIKDKAVKDKIDSMHEKNLFKLQLMPAYNPEEN